MERVMVLLYQRAVELVDRLMLLDDTTCYSIPLARYILSTPCAVPIRYIILGERPYATDIHPYVSSALSYDPVAQHAPTPSVDYMSRCLAEISDIPQIEIVSWLRDSWKYLSQGVVLLNICALHKFSSNESEVERIAIEEYLRDVIRISQIMCNDTIRIFALGNPARHSAHRIKSSLPNTGSTVTVHGMINPASAQHRGDLMSQFYTLGKGSRAASKRICKIISCTRILRDQLRCSDFDKMASGDFSDINRAVASGTSMAKTFDEIESYFKRNSKGGTVESNAELFGRASAEVKEFVLALQSSRIRLLLTNSAEPKGTGKPSYYNSRRDYNSMTFNRGASSHVSSTPTASRAREIGFVDDDDVPSTPDVASRIPNVSLSTPDIMVNKRKSIPRSLPDLAIRTASVSKSITSRNSIAVGFADDESPLGTHYEADEKPDATVAQASTATSGQSEIGGQDLDDMSLVLDFIENSDELKFDQVLIEVLRDTVRCKRVSPGVSIELLELIKMIRGDSTQRSLEDSLGYTNDIVDMPSKIVQWVMSKAV